MHAVLLTLLTLSGADPAYATMPAPYPAAAYGAVGAGCESGMCGAAGCGTCGTTSGYGSHYDRRVNRQLQHYMSGRKSGPMPQTCYAPRFGCYNGNDRHMHRYPAFHGTYYRRPYNYRNLFEYPWHAEMHEPTSYFSYNVPPQGAMPEAMPLPGNAPPMPNEASFPARALPIAPQPSAPPLFAPQNTTSASYNPEIANEAFHVLPPPRLSDQELAGVPMETIIEQDRLVPAPIESIVDATPYVEGRFAGQPTPATAAPASQGRPAAEFAPRVSSRPLSGGPQMLQPLTSEAANDAQPVEARPISSRQEPTELAPPQVNAKPISLRKPQTIPGQATASVNESRQVQPASANQPIGQQRIAAPASGSANPLRQ